MPPFTVASFATMTQRWPLTVPMPVMSPAAGTGSSYTLARGERRELEERRVRVEQARDALARQELAARDDGARAPRRSPPSRASARRASSSATRARIASAEARNSALSVFSLERMTVMGHRRAGRSDRDGAG